MPDYKIKWRDKVTPRLETLPINIHKAMLDGVTETLARGTKVTRRKVITSHTRTGRLRARGGVPKGFTPRPAWFLHRGPGRVESGAMLNSVRWRLDTAVGRRVSGQGGFINAPRYTQAQEDDPEGKIPPMHAFLLGKTTVAARYPILMDRYLGQAVRASQNGKLYRSKS